MTPREKVLRDALEEQRRAALKLGRAVGKASFSDYVEREVLAKRCRQFSLDVASALAAADAIPDAPVVPAKCKACGKDRYDAFHIRTHDDWGRSEVHDFEPIPAAPTTEEICASCGVRRSYHGEGYSGGFTDERSCRKFIDAMDAQSIPDAPVECPGCNDQCQKCRDKPPVPSRAELIELSVAAYGDWPPLPSPARLARVLDALIKAGVART